MFEWVGVGGLCCLAMRAEVTIKSLRERVRELEERVEERVAERVAEREQLLARQLLDKENVLHDRETDMGHRLHAKENEANTLHNGYTRHSHPSPPYTHTFIHSPLVFDFMQSPFL